MARRRGKWVKKSDRQIAPQAHRAQACSFRVIGAMTGVVMPLSVGTARLAMAGVVAMRSPKQALMCEGGVGCMRLSRAPAGKGSP